MKAIYLNDDLHKKYKAVCSELGISMKEKTQELIVNFLKKHMERTGLDEKSKIPAKRARMNAEMSDK